MVSRQSAALAAALLAAGVPAQAQVFVGLPSTEGQAVVLSNFVSAQAPTLLLADEPPPVEPAPAGRVPAATSLAALIDAAARRAGISPALIHAVIATESNFDANAVSRKGALGLMQLLPQTASRFGVRQPLDPGENILGGAQYLRWLADRFDGRLDLVLAAYNAGEGNVVRSGYRVPDFAETRAYVRSVLRKVRCSGVEQCSAAAVGST